MSIDFLTLVYVIYAATSLGLIVWLARTLGRNGQVFLEDVFRDRPQLAESINRLLVVGFYLINLGYAAVMLEGGVAGSLRQGLEALATKLGWLLLSLGIMHFMNMFVFYRIRRRVGLAAAPPLRETGRVAPAVGAAHAS